MYNDYKFDDNSSENIVIKVSHLLNEEKSINSLIKELDSQLTNKAKDLLTKLSFNEACELLQKKWIMPLYNDILNYTDIVLNNFKSKINDLVTKYDVSLIDIEKEINDNSIELIKLMSDLKGNDDDIKAINDLIALLGDKNG